VDDDLKTNPREPLEKLKQYSAFQALRAKAETHEFHFRPKEALLLQNVGLLDEVLDSRTESFWNALVDCLANGTHLNEAEGQKVSHPDSTESGLNRRLTFN